MTVVAIIALLVSLLIYGLTQFRRSAYEKGTRGVLDQIRLAVDAYHNQYKVYPPDGFDEPAYRELPGGGGRQQIRGTACLIYYLGLPTVEVIETGGSKTYKEKEPLLELTAEMLSGEGTIEERLNDPTTELVDRWGNPLHYDNVEFGKDKKTPRLSPQNEPSVHTTKGLDAEQQHGPDPRLKGDGKGGSGGGLEAKNPGAYDLWSHGSVVAGDDAAAATADDIANWKDTEK
jgi:hypothetical protein